MADDERSDSAPAAPTDATESPAVESSIPLSSRLLAWGRRFFFLATAIAWGLLMGVLIWRPYAVPPTASPGHAGGGSPEMGSVNIEGSPGEASRAQTALERLQAADRLLATGSVGRALEQYARIWKNPPPPRPYDHLLYRIAVAREIVGELETALTHYGDVVRLASSERIAAAAQLGQARIWLSQGRFNLATTVLCELAFHPDIATFPDQALAGWRAHLFALAATSQANLRRSPTRLGSALDDHDCVSATPNFDGDELLRLPVPADQQARIKIEPGVAVLYQFGQRPEQMQVRVSLSRQSLVEAVELVSEATAAQVHWSEEARKRCQVRTKPVLAANSSLATFLDHLLLPADVAWIWDDGKIIIRDPSDIDEHKLATATWERAERAARFASSAHAGHPLAPFVYLTMGNAAYRRSDFEAAEAAYRQLLQLPISSPTRTEATFNLAKTLRITSKHEDALNMFYRTADVGQGHPLRSAAYLYAGRLHLEWGDISDSIRPLMRAASLAPDDVTKQVAAVTLASAYLLADNPHAANTVLMRFRESLNGQNFEGVAALLASFARLQVAEGSAKIRSGRAVITALNQVSAVDFFGSLGHLMMGRAFGATGLLQQMVDTYEAALDIELPTWVRNETQTALAAYHMDTARYERARQLLGELVDSPRTELAVDAAIELARIDLLQSREDDCLSACRQLLQRELTEPQKNDVLVLMGKAHQARSEHYQAALCFAGMVPGSDNAGFAMQPTPADPTNRKSTTSHDQSNPNSEN